MTYRKPVVYLYLKNINVKSDDLLMPWFDTEKSLDESLKMPNK